MTRKQNTWGTGRGKGHGGNTPNLPVIHEISLPPLVRRQIALGSIQPGTRAFRMGKCRMMVSPPTGKHGWHISISRNDRYPSWDEIAKARYELVPDEAEMVMHLPSQKDYVNIHNYCFHLHELMRDSTSEIVKDATL